MTVKKTDIGTKSLKIKTLEITFWFTFAAVFWTINTQTIIADNIRNDVPYKLSHLIMIEATSAIAAILMITFVVSWSARFPFKSEKIVEYVLRHLLGSVIFSLGHIGLMALFREILFSKYINSFVSNGIFTTLLYEYRKDIGLYITVLLVITGYRLHREKKLLEAKSPSKNADRILVKTRKGEKLIDRSSIEWIKAAANYVEIHTAEGEYLVRCTMAEMERTLSSSMFARVHKSFIVNLNTVNEISPTESGDFRITTNSGAVIPLSRRYRDSLDGLISL